MRGLRLSLALFVVVAACLASAGPAGAHATLQNTIPERGAELEEAPPALELQFSEPVETSFGAVRLYDSSGNQIEGAEEFRPSGESSALGLRLPSDLPDGGYTATYRVVSADSHPISGGFVFTVGKGSAGPAASVTDLLGDDDAGPVTGAAAGVIRFAVYASIALVIGGIAFGIFVWGPALRRVASADRSWRDASDAFSARLHAIVTGAIVVGFVAGGIGIVVQGAIAGGMSVWDAVDPDVIGDVLSTRFGEVWALREAAWLCLGAAFLIVPASRPVPRLRTVDLGAAGLAAGSGPSPVRFAFLALPAAFIVLSPGLAGHASTRSPEALLVAADGIHVLAMAVWVGGIALLLWGLRAATANLADPDRTRLLAAAVSRFSPLALTSVLALVATGTLAAIVHLEAVSDLWETGFGRAIAVKIGILTALVSIGALHRRRLIPDLERAADGGEAPGGAGRTTRRALRAEFALFAAVIAVSAILVGQTTPDAVSAGPASVSATIGEAQLDLNVEPAQAGSNEIHIYLIASDDGSQYDVLRDVELTATLPEKDIGPLEIELRRAGPGHYTTSNAALGAPGTWELTLSGRVSRFEEPRAVVEVPIE